MLVTDKIVKALKNTTIASLTNFDLEKLQRGISGTVKKTATIAQEATGKAIDAGKDLIEENASETAKETVGKAVDTLKKFLPFGKKEKE